MNWAKVLDPQTGFQCLPFYDGSSGAKVVAVEAEDDRTVVIRLDQPSSVFLEQLAYIQCPVGVLHPDSWDSAGEWAKPIGTGPYRFAEWRKGRYVLLEKFPQYVPREEPASGLAGRKVAHAQYLRFVVITDLMATKAAVVSGQIDIASYLAPVTALELRHNRRVVTMSSEGLSRRTLLIQTADPLLSNVLLRRAMAHALDLETLADVATLGHADHNPSTIPASLTQHTKFHSQPYEYDPRRSIRLIEEAGYDNQPIVLTTTREEQAYFDMAMIAEAMWKRVGLNVLVEVVELGTLLSRYFDGDYQVVAFEYSARLTAAMNMETMLGDKSVAPNRWDDPLANELLSRAGSTSDPAARQALFDRIHERMMTEVPVINLYNAPIVDVTSKRIRGYEPWPGAKPRLWNVEVIE
jgi:peptide/nickel transport system substrate-binding protein